jgi:Fe-S cluster assembly protein SufD
LHDLKGDRHADSHTFIEHIAPNARSNQLYKAILGEQSRSVFNGRVLVHREAQLTNSYQLNKNLILSREARVDTKPQLEIFADDVKCTHGATIGQLDEDQVFYLATRGITKDAATAMLIRGFIDDVLAQIQDPVLKTKLINMMGSYV